MDDKEAISKAKDYISKVYEGEPISNLGLEEIEYSRHSAQWMVTIGFSRPFNTPRTRAQEVIESIGGVPPLKRMYKVVTIEDGGNVVSMKNRVSENA